MPYSAATQAGHLTTNIKRANAMADSNDTRHPENEQQLFSSLFPVLNQYHATIYNSETVTQSVFRSMKRKGHVTPATVIGRGSRN